MMKSIFPCLLFCCFSIVHAGYDDGLISAGEYEWGVEWLNGLLVVNGGGAQEIRVRNSARLEVRSTSTPLGLGVGGIMDLVLYNSCHMDYFGGQTEELRVRNNATANLYGGRIDYISSDQNVFNVIVGWDELGNPIYNTHIEMFVKTHTYNEITKMLTGTWTDNTTFSIKLLDQAGYDRVIDNIKFTIIPEPATLALFTLGGFLIRRKK